MTILLSNPIYAIDVANNVINYTLIQTNERNLNGKKERIRPCYRASKFSFDLKQWIGGQILSLRQDYSKLWPHDRQMIFVD